MSPMKTMGRVASTRATIGNSMEELVRPDAQMNPAVPSTGGSAANPGNGVAFVYMKETMTIATVPAAAMISRAAFEAGGGTGATAMIAPASSSHAREGRRKNAAAGVRDTPTQATARLSKALTTKRRARFFRSRNL